MNDTKKPYGDVAYADPGYRDGTKRYPVNTPEHVRAAWAYINVPKNAAFYNEKQLAHIKDAIKKAAEQMGVEIADDSGELASGVSVLASANAGAALLASVAPLAPPAAWFQDPKLAAPTRVTITDDGRVFGHLAQWRVCHVGIGNKCVVAPKSRMNYSLFRQGQVRTDDGQLVNIGKITLGTGHADAHWGVIPSREHYDNSGWAAAVVNIGEDRHGIWVSGALATTMTPERVAELRSTALSGDWREVNGNLELIAALAVNAPGFPIFREQGGSAFSLLAVGVIGQEELEGFMDEEEEFDGEFAVEDDDAEFAVDEDDDEEVDPELAARLERLDAIDEDLAEYNQERRMAQLAAIDGERDALAERSAPAGSISPTASDDAVFIQYNARYHTVAVDADEEE